MAPTKNNKQKNTNQQQQYTNKKTNNPSNDQKKTIINNKKKTTTTSTTTTTKKSCSSCYWLFGIIVLSGCIGGLLRYDTVQNGHGIFAKSATGKFLKDIGALPYVEIGATQTLHYSARGYQWAEINVPIYYLKVKEFIVPYINFGIDLSKISFNILKDQWANLKELIKVKTPLVTNFIEQYAPGLPQKIQDFSISTYNTIKDVSITTYTTGCDFFKTKVFVGTLSPENLGKRFVKFQECAANYYTWFQAEVETHAKVQ